MTGVETKAEADNRAVSVRRPALSGARAARFCPISAHPCGRARSRPASRERWVAAVDADLGAFAARHDDGARAASPQARRSLNSAVMTSAPDRRLNRTKMRTVFVAATSVRGRASPSPMSDRKGSRGEPAASIGTSPPGRNTGAFLSCGGSRADAGRDAAQPSAQVRSRLPVLTRSRSSMERSHRAFTSVQSAM